MSAVKRSRMSEVHSDDWTNLQTKFSKITHTWNIENFSVTREGENKWISCVFPVDQSNKLKWYLELTVNDKEFRGREYLTLTLNLVEWDGSTEKTIVRCSIMSHEETEQRRMFTMSHQAIVTFNTFINCYKLLDKTNNYLPNDKLSIFCEIILPTDTVSTSGRTQTIDVPDSKISDNFGKLFNNPKFSDVKIVTKGMEIYAHKNILAARSPVFEAMFSSATEENQRGVVTIDDMDPEVQTEMLRFIYTDHAPNLDKMSRDLLVASQKYSLPKLKAMCEKSLVATLSIENAAETLVFADLYNANQLKARTIDFIKVNMDDVRRTAGWQDMSQNHFALIREHFVYWNPHCSQLTQEKTNYRKFSCPKCS
ncbi:protein roadkill-like [Drosophila montana]|uniref:protein roadkill-like n=1 Tax=Drosophila montana TaxID=40370 RepID=UPI00313C5A75